MKRDADSRWRLFAPHLIFSISVLVALGVRVPALGAASIPSGAPVEATALTASRPAPASAQVLHRTIWSESLGREMPATVFLPPGYDSTPDTRYPVLYMLHGLGGDHTQWERDGLLSTAADLMQRGEITRFIIVLPEGERGYWIDHANGGPQFGNYISQDLVSLVDREYRTQPSRSARAIGGMSMGGHGALQLALNNPQTFGVVGAHSLALRTKEQAFDFFGNAQYFQAHDPVSMVQTRTAAARQLVISIDIGASDQWEKAAEAFHSALLTKGLDHQWAVQAGGHDDAYWTAHVPDYLRYYGQALGPQSALTADE